MDEPMSTDTDPSDPSQGDPTEGDASDGAGNGGNGGDDGQTRWAPPLPPPPPTARPSWLDVPIARDRDNRKVGGVVAGISRAYGFDRRTTRVAVALGALVLPGVFALYIASMIFLPGRPEEASTLREIFTERRRRPLLIVLGILAIATGFGSWAFFGGLGWGFALVAVGIVLWLSPNFGSTTPRPTTQRPTTSSPPGAAPQWTFDSAAIRTAPTPPVRRRRYPIQAIALAAASVGALVAGIGNSADWWTVSIYGVVVGVLASLIVATIVGVIVNRSWFGVPMLLMLGASTVGIVMTHPNLEGGIGDRTFRPTTVADAQIRQQLGIGRLTLDLTEVPLGEQALMVDAEVGYGQVRVLVPADTEVRIVSDINAGHIIINGDETAAGFRRDDVTTVPARTTEGAQHTIVLEVGVGGGEVKVTQVD